MDIEPDVTLCKIDVMATGLVDFDGADDSRDDDESTHGKDQRAK